MAALAVLTLIFLIIPYDFPTVPYLSFYSISLIKAAKESLKHYDIPQWNPYIGGGFDIAPTSYYILYALGRPGIILLTFMIAVLSIIVPNVSRIIKLILILPSASLSMLIPSMLPIIISVYILGFIAESPFLRSIGSLGIPFTAFTLEMSIQNPSISVLLISLSCIFDIVAAYLYDVHFVDIINAILFTLPPAFLAFFQIKILEKIIPKYKWNIAIIAIPLLALVQIIMLYPTTIFYNIILLSITLLKLIDAYISSIEVINNHLNYVSLYFSVLILFTSSAAIYTLSAPKFTVVKYKHLRAPGPIYVISPDIWFTECTKLIVKGHPVWNSPIPNLAKLCYSYMLGVTIGDPRLFLTIIPVVGSYNRIKPNILIPIVISPPSWSEKLSVSERIAVHAVKLRQLVVHDFKLVSPNEIKGRGLLGQLYSPWWWGSKCRYGLMYIRGTAHYYRPSALVSLILSISGITIAAVSAARARNDSS
ncbi:hypothetical protein [Methanopyrus sp.]